VAGTAATFVERPRIVVGLRRALDKGGALLVAPAGYGKTSALQQTLAEGAGPVVWISCADTGGGDAGLLLQRLVERLRDVLPGSADVLAERLAATLQRVDVEAIARTLRAELEELVVEPVTLVLDDAEALDSPDSLAVVETLLHSDPRTLRVALATRRPLALRTSRLVAAGRLTRLGAAELAFDSQECEEILRGRYGRDPTADEVGALMASTEGWPLGIALSEVAPGHAGTSPQAGRDTVFSFLDEEVLDELEDGVRRQILDSAQVAELTEEVMAALGLPADFPAAVQRAGLVLRASGDQGGSWTYHPLVREFLRARVARDRSPQELRDLHARVAGALAGSGREREAVAHWLEADEWAAAVASAVRLGVELQRLSPTTVRGWLDALPRTAWDHPAPQLLLGQLEWGSGRHDQSIDPLRAAVAGYDAGGDLASAWLARWILCDALFTTGGFDEIERIAEGWDDPALADLGPLPAGVAWYAAFVLLSRGRFKRADALLERLRADAVLAPIMRHFDTMFQAYRDLGRGRVEAGLDGLRATVAELEGHDPGNRSWYALATWALMQMDCGQHAEALRTWARLVGEAERAGLSFAASTGRWQRAFLYATAGDLTRAERELEAAGVPSGSGWHDRSFHNARAAIAVMRNDPEAAVAGAQRSRELVSPASLNFRVWNAAEVAPILVAAGAPQLAREGIDETLEALDAAFPGDSGRYSRARLLVLRGWLRSLDGDVAGSDADIALTWGQAQGCEHHILRAEWPRLEPLVTRALERRTLDAESVIGALEEAFPGGAALVQFLDHPRAEVRRAALPAAVGSGHPAALARLAQLGSDPDPGVAAAARAALERLPRNPPPLTFRVLGDFRVRRASWEVDTQSWGRPLVARLVRFLLVHRDTAVPEDALFEAFWPDMDPEKARRNLSVALSLARKALDAPGVQESVIHSDGRMHQLRLHPADRVDSEEFESAATAALRVGAAPEALAMLERADELWAGLPLPGELYEPWSFAWRERLTDRYTHVLAALSQAYASAGRGEDAIRLARTWVDLDPLNEAAQRELIAGYARAGRRNQALRQFLACRRTLVDELGIEPSAATVALQERVLAGTLV
jgi:DNA-binding SARP family transcriptional activator